MPAFRQAHAAESVYPGAGGVIRISEQLEGGVDVGSCSRMIVQRPENCRAPAKGVRACALCCSALIARHDFHCTRELIPCWTIHAPALVLPSAVAGGDTLPPQPCACPETGAVLVEALCWPGSTPIFCAVRPASRV